MYMYMYFMYAYTCIYFITDTLAILYVPGNQISIIDPLLINGLSNLRILNLCENLITTLPELLMLQDLMFLYLNTNPISHLDDHVFSNLDSVDKIEIYSNALNDTTLILPALISELHLHIQPSASIRLEFKEERNLDFQLFCMSDNGSLPDVTKIQNNISHFEIECPYHSFIDMDPFLGKIDTFAIKFCSVSPNSNILEHILDVRKLWLKKMNITDELIIQIGLAGLQKLEIVNLERNLLETIPEVYGSVDTLERLVLEHNNIKYISSSVLHLYSVLTELDLSYNPIMNIESIPYLPALTELDIR